MVVNPQDFLTHAKKLVANNSANELDCRSAVSRAYYSLFHEASNFLEARGRYRRVIRGAHEKVKNVLFDIDPIVGMEFDTHKDSRHDADYNLRASVFTLQNSCIVVNEIETFISAVKNLDI